MLEFAQQLVGIAGESGQEEEVARRVKEQLESLSFDDVWVDDAGNVLARIKGKKKHSQRTVLFDAHMDTVGVEDAGAWQYPPHGGQIVKGRLYGRGAVDMRGALAAMVYGLASLDRHQLEGQVYFSASVCEEILEGAAFSQVLTATEPDSVVIGEPTGLAVACAQRGRAELALQVQGKTAHSAWPTRGLCAVEGFCRAHLAMMELEPPEHPQLGKGITVLTDVVSTPYPGRSVVPFMCRATLDRRLLPGEKIEDVVHELMQKAQSATSLPLQLEVVEGEVVTYTGYEIKRRKLFLPWELSARHPLVTSARDALRARGLPAELTTYAFCTNGSASAGERGIPTIGFGPGEESEAHQADESVSIDELKAAMEGYQALALGLSMHPSRQLSLLDL